MLQIKNTNTRSYITGMAYTGYGNDKIMYLLSVLGPQNAVKSIWATFVQSKGELRVETNSWKNRDKGEKYKRGSFQSKRYTSCIDRDTNYHNLVVFPTNLPNFLWVRDPTCIDRDPTTEERAIATADISRQLLAYVNTQNTVVLPQWSNWLWNRCEYLSGFTRMNVYGDVITAITISPDIKWPEVIAHGLESGAISF